MAITGKRLDDCYIDQATQEQFCPACNALLIRRDTVVADHLAMVWHHYVSTRFHQILATDERGMTIEDTEEHPSRVILSKVPHMTHLLYCVSCNPIAFEEECAGCGTPVDLDGEHTQVEILHRRVSGVHYGYHKREFHLDCLPVHFDTVQDIRQERLDKITKHAGNV